MAFALLALVGLILGLAAPAMAQTLPVLTGGLDLSVGSMMGLAAVVMGGLWRDAHLSMGLAIALTLLAGMLGGALNALMITRLKFPPLIVTLGTFSLFRGIAEGLTRGIENYSGFSSRFLFLRTSLSLTPATTISPSAFNGSQRLLPQHRCPGG